MPKKKKSEEDSVLKNEQLVLNEDSSKVSLDAIKEELTDYMKRRVDEEIAKGVSGLDATDIKDDLSDYMKNKIDISVSKATEKSYKKLVHHKNVIIIKRDITILILLIMVFFLGYNLYNLSEINIDVTTSKKNESLVSEKKEEITEELSELETDYSYLLDNVIFSSSSEYVSDYYGGKLTDEVKLYLSFSNMDVENIVSEDDMVSFDSNDLKDIYEKLFDTEYSPKAFRYGNLSFKYLPSKELFIADGEFKRVSSDIVRAVIDTKNDDDKVIITVVEGFMKNKKLYNILSGKEITKYSGDLSKVQSDLTKIIYEFTKVDDNYMLTSLKNK